ncbi:MAG TPA: FHA domain-containing protein [Vicinamibacterales bacterium]|nr:FHA domain-containing protein [Vicinamibacterales bacterium]
MWILQTIEETGAPPHTFRLSAGAIKTIGRATRADFIVDRVTVSRLHCRLTADGDQMQVVDLDSTNGTFVNGARISQGTLAAGDRLRVGRVEFSVTRGSRADDA